MMSTVAVHAGGHSDMMMTRRSVLHCLAGSWTACRWQGSAAEIGPQVQTVTGPAPDLGPTLMHEHIVTDLRAPSDRRPGDYDPDKAYEAVLPYLRELHQAGCRCLVEPTPIHIGRDPNVLRRLSKTSNIRIVAATGIYGAAKQKFVPQYAREQDAQQLAEGYIREYDEGIQSTGIRPGIIKTGVNQDVPLPEIEQKLVLAAVLAHKATGLTVASHTGSGAAALAQLGILESAGASPSRFIWVHAQNEKDHSLHRQLAREGMWVEFDGIRASTLDWHLECVQVMADAGLLDRVLISQDAGWYRPGEPGGGKFRGYKYLFADFLPALERAGFSKADVEQLIEINPMRALRGSH